MMNRTSDRRRRQRASRETLDRAARFLAAAGDSARLELLELLGAGECDVGTIAEATGAQLSTVSQRLRLLRSEGLVAARRDGKHIYYRLADDHVCDIIRTVLVHAAHPPRHND